MFDREQERVQTLEFISLLILTALVNSAFFFATYTEPGIVPSMDIRSNYERNAYRPYYFFANQFFKV